MNQNHFLILSFIFLLIPLAKAQEPYRKDTKGNIYVPAAEYTHTETGKKVLFVGMSHIDTALFYERASQYIDVWVSTRKVKSLLLEEFFTCNTEVYDSDVVSFNDNEVDQFVSFGIDFSPENFILQGPHNLTNLFDLFQFQKRKCVLDVDNKTYRPDYLVDRNRDGCNQAHELGIGCQWEDFLIADHENLVKENGDLKIDDEADEIQFVGFMMYRNLDYSDYMKPLYKIFDSVRYVVLDYRNDHLIKKTMKALFDRNYDNVILPWGARHIYGVKKLLLENGFMQTRVEDILLNSPEEQRQLEPMGMGWEGVELSESYDF